MNNLLNIRGRAAVPLRLLRFASNWLDLNTIARGLARLGDEAAPALKAYCLDGAEVSELLPYRWDDWVDKLAQNPGIKHANVLTAGVFLWRDELQRAYDDVFLDAKSYLEKYGYDNPDGTSYTGHRIGDMELHLDCVLTFEQRQWAFEGFELSIEETPPIEGETESAPPVLENWKMRIQAEAASRWATQKKLGCSPTKLALQRELATWCRENNVVTETTGITPSESYIYRHVLRGWTPPKDH